MSATDHLNSQQFVYHTSPHVFAPGDRVEPGHDPVFSTRPKEHVYVTTSRRNAVQWARSASLVDSDYTHAHVYQVARPAAMEPDPNPTGTGEYRTRESLPVLRKIRTVKGMA